MLINEDCVSGNWSTSELERTIDRLKEGFVLNHLLDLLKSDPEHRIALKVKKVLSDCSPYQANVKVSGKAILRILQSLYGLEAVHNFFLNEQSQKLIRSNTAKRFKVQYSKLVTTLVLLLLEHEELAFKKDSSFMTETKGRDFVKTLRKKAETEPEYRKFVEPSNSPNVIFTIVDAAAAQKANTFFLQQ